jgi:hypothetical protein
MDGDAEKLGFLHIEKPQHRELTIFAPAQEISGLQIEALYEALNGAQADDPGMLESFTIYSELGRKRLAVRLGVVGIHPQLHEAALSYGSLMTEQGVVPQHGQHEWRIGH